MQIEERVDADRTYKVCSEEERWILLENNAESSNPHKSNEDEPPI